MSSASANNAKDAYATNSFIELRTDKVSHTRCFWNTDMDILSLACIVSLEHWLADELPARRDELMLMYTLVVDCAHVHELYLVESAKVDCAELITASASDNAHKGKKLSVTVLEAQLHDCVVESDSQRKMDALKPDDEQENSDGLQDANNAQGTDRAPQACGTQSVIMCD